MQDQLDDTVRQRRDRLAAEHLLRTGTARARQERDRLDDELRRQSARGDVAREELTSLRAVLAGVEAERALLVRRLEDAREQERQTVLDALPFASAIFSGDRRLLSANAQYLALFDGLEEARPGTSYLRLMELLLQEGAVNPGPHGHDWATRAALRLDASPPPDLDLTLWDGRRLRLCDTILPDGGFMSRLEDRHSLHPSATSDPLAKGRSAREPATSDGATELHADDPELPPDSGVPCGSGAVHMVGTGRDGEAELLRPDDDGGASETAELEPINPQRRIMRVLAAEDDAVNRLVLSKLLEPSGVELTIVEDGAQALEHLRRESPDLLLTDISMPIMNGKELVRRLRAEETRSGSPRLRVVAMTAHALQSDIDAMLATGIDRVLSKPLARDILEDEIETARSARETGDASCSGDTDLA